VPAKNGVRRHDRRDVGQQRAAQAVAQLGEPSTLMIIETQASPLKPRLQHSILFAQERDHVLCLPETPYASHRLRLRAFSGADWDYLIAERWFPFISLPPALKQKFIAFAKDRTDLNRLLPEVSAHVRNHLGEMVQRWESSQLFGPHLSFLKLAAERFEHNDFVR
jgi:hypothetical protein